MTNPLEEAVWILVSQEGEESLPGTYLEALDAYDALEGKFGARIKREGRLSGEERRRDGQGGGAHQGEGEGDHAGT